MARFPSRAPRAFLPRWAPARLLALAACVSEVEVPDDATACAGLKCSAGQCFSNAGQPMCRCGAWEQTAGVACEVGGVAEPDDPGGSPESAAVLPLPMEAANGLIEPEERSGMVDRDLYAFTAESRHVYAFSCAMQTLDRCGLRLLDTEGNTVPSDVVGNEVGTVLYATLEAGTWYVEVAGVEVSGNENESWGSYAYQLVDRGADDHGNTHATASTLVPSQESFEVVHTLAYDWDVFTFRSRPYHGYRFICEQRPHKWELRLTSQGGAELDVVTGTVRDPATLSLYSAQEASWFVRMRVQETAFPASSSCRLLDLGPDEHVDGLAGATPLTHGVPVRVTLQSSQDVDVLSFSAQAGHVYAVRAEGPGTWTAEVLADDWRVLRTGEEVGELGFKPEAPGTYYLRVRGGRAWFPTTLVSVVDLGLEQVPWSFTLRQE